MSEVARHINAGASGARPCVSIIVPCFNSIPTIGAAIESSLIEEGIQQEIIIVDDGSTDDSFGIARSFEPRLRVLPGPHQGVSAARNRGIAATQGEWVVFLDADDVLIPGTLCRRLETAGATGANVIVCDWQEFRETEAGTVDGAVRSVDLAALEADTEIACATRVWAPTAALMYRRSLVDKIGGFRKDLPVIQDARFLFDAAYHGARFAHSAHVGARYRIAPHSLSRRDPARFWRDVLLNGKQIEALWRARDALSGARGAALAEIYNGAAHGLFRAADPSFREALAVLRGFGLPVSSRNLLAELLSDIAGQSRAIRVASCWTRSRRIATGGCRQPPFVRAAPG